MNQKHKGNKGVLIDWTVIGEMRFQPITGGIHRERVLTSTGNNEQIRKVEHKKGSDRYIMCGRTRMTTFWRKIMNIRYTRYEANIGL